MQSCTLPYRRYFTMVEGSVAVPASLPSRKAVPGSCMFADGNTPLRKKVKRQKNEQM